MKFLVIFLFALLLAVPVMVQADDSPSPGQLIEVNGVNLYISCTGEGSPTVLIDAGMGEWSLHWLSVQEALNDFTRVCVYDRAGYGWSERSDQNHDGQEVVDELNQLLQAAKIDGPYIALGHSLGGAHMRLFAAQNSNVVGLILVDTPHPDIQPLIEIQDLMAKTYAQFPALIPLAEQGLLHPDDMPIPDYLPAELAEQYQQQVATPGFFSALYGEYTALEQTMAEVKEAAIPQSLPVTIIAARLPDVIPGISPDLLQTYQENQWLPAQQLVADSFPNSRLVIAENSHHHIQFDEPDVIVDEVVALIEKVNS